MVGDYEPIEAFLVGECGYTARQAAEVTFREYMYKFRAREKRAIEAWEVARWEVFQHIWLSPNIAKRHKPKRVTDILRLPTDEREPRKNYISLTPSQEEIEALRFNGIIK